MANPSARPGLSGGAFLDALRVKIRDEGLVKSKAAYVALVFNPDGEGDTRTAMRRLWWRAVRDLLRLARPDGTDVNGDVGATTPEVKAKSWPINASTAPRYSARGPRRRLS